MSRFTVIVYTNSSFFLNLRKDLCICSNKYRKCLVFVTRFGPDTRENRMRATFSVFIEHFYEFSCIFGSKNSLL